MASSSETTKLSYVMSKLNLPINTTNQSAYDVAGQSPSTIATHAMSKQYNILGITPKEFIDLHGAVAFNIKDLNESFSKICTDYNTDLQMDTANRSVEFCSKIIYEVGPMARQIRKKDGDKVWKFAFFYKDPEDSSKVAVKTAFVCTFKSENANSSHFKSEDKIVLTIKQASLLS